MEIPEYVFGIPTKKTRSKERVALIRRYYTDLWIKLQKEGKRNSVFNDYLGVEIYVVEKAIKRRFTLRQKTGSRHTP